MESRYCITTSRDLEDSGFRRVLDGFLNLFYPDSCFICSASVSRVRECGVCRRCWENSLQLRIQDPLCPSCGIPFLSDSLESGHLCGECLLEMPAYSGARSFGYYRAELREMVMGLKFRGRKNLSEPLSALMATAFISFWSRGDFDCLVPMPLHPGRKRERGFNQAALLAFGCSRFIGISVVDNALVRTRPTLPQVGLSDSARRQNVHQAFRCNRPLMIQGKRILLVDDVMTTGATVRSASETLLKCGAARVSALSVARAVPGFE